MKATHVAVLAAFVPSDALDFEDQPRPLVPAGRSLLDIIVPALKSAGFGTPAVMPTSSGYWVRPIQGRGRSFDLVVSDIRPIYVCEITETRSLGEWIRGAARDPQFEVAFKTVCECVRDDPRVSELLAFSRSKKESDAFVGRAIERLERALGIYSR